VLISRPVQFWPVEGGYYFVEWDGAKEGHAKCAYLQHIGGRILQRGDVDGGKKSF